MKNTVLLILMALLCIFLRLGPTLSEVTFQPPQRQVGNPVTYEGFPANLNPPLVTSGMVTPTARNLRSSAGETCVVDGVVLVGGLCTALNLADGAGRGLGLPGVGGRGRGGRGRGGRGRGGRGRGGRGRGSRGGGAGGNSGDNDDHPD